MNLQMLNVCVVIPCYNEEKRLQSQALVEFVQSTQHIQFLFVDDCSGDKTKVLLEEMQSQLPEQISFVSTLKNGGKAEAVRFGVNYAMQHNSSFTHLGFMDADLATPLSEVPRILQYFQVDPSAKFVLCSRIQKLGSNIHRKLARHYLGRTFATVVSLMFKMRVYDTQCGAKFLTKDLAHVCFSEPFVSSWFFDIELLIRAKKYLFGGTIPPDNTQMIEHPLKNWEDVNGSKLTLLDFLSVPLELFKIFFHYRFYRGARNGSH